MSLLGDVLLGAKWLTFHVLCGGNYERYMALRAQAVRHAAARGLYEAAQLRFIQKSLRLGDTAVDVGANLGAYAISLAEAVGPTGRVHAFEPLEETYRRLQLYSRRYSQLSCHRVALSDHTGTSEIHVPLLFGRIPEASLASLNPESGQRRQVAVARLDDYELPGLRFIKVDIEGHELSFFHGARRTLQQHRPIVQFESNDMPTKLESFRAFATPLGYTVCELNERGDLIPLDRAPTYGIYNFYLRPQ